MRYYSKVLLFGEHIVNKGANALAIPYPQFYCELVRDARQASMAELSHEILTKIAEWINQSNLLKSNIHLEQFKADISNGLFINMNIPIGYGLGSSGALIACIYERYHAKAITDYKELQAFLGEMESVFHGKSSGLDPLVSYTGKNILVSEGKISFVEAPERLLDDRQLDIRLIDTGKTRQTGPLVDAFLAKCESDEAFNSVVTEELVPLNNEMIALYLAGNWEALLPKMKQFSALQLQHLDFLILPEHQALWQAGLDSDDYYLKICGAGGGGFMLGFGGEPEGMKEYGVE